MIHLIFTKQGLSSCLQVCAATDRLYLSTSLAAQLPELTSAPELAGLYLLDEAGCAALAQDLLQDKSVSWY